MAVIFSSLLADIVFILMVLCLLMYLYTVNAFKYWDKRGIYYLEPTLFFGNMGSVALQRETVGKFLARVYEENPNHPVVGVFALHKPWLVVRDLELVRSILVKDAHVFLDRSFQPPKGVDTLISKSLFVQTGKKWRHLRIKLTPTFTSGKIKKMFCLIEECGKQLIPSIEREVSKGDSVVVKEMMARYSTDVIASCAFGVNANALEDPNCQFRSSMKKMFEPTTLQMLANMLSLFLPWLRRIIRLKAIDGSVDSFVRETFWEVVSYRKKNRVDRKDFVNLLMQIQEAGEVQADDMKDLEEIKQDSKYMNIDFSKNYKSDIKLDDDDIVAQAFIFMVAGFETSSSVITFTLFELALNLPIQERLRSEIKSVLEKHGGQVAYEAIAEMNYLDMVVSESLRKYPTLPMLERKCLSDYTLQGTDIKIEKGTVISIPVMGIHYDPEIYPDPEKFDPERFSAKNKSERSHFAHLPFGEGPRICIGMRFGQMQVKTALVHVLMAFKVRPCEDTPKPPLEYEAFSGLLLPKKNIVLSFAKID